MKLFSIHYFANACMVAFAITAALIGYDRLVVRPSQVIGVVDVGEVYRLKEAEFTRLLTKAASENERQKALLMAHQFAQRLPLALEELPRECRCLVVVRTAVVGNPPNAFDLTALLKQKVDLP
jgi:NAD(P)H-nitrite reductase large subunit